MSPADWPHDSEGRWFAPMPVDALTCPLCGGTVKWHCPAQNGDEGHADCEDGGRVSRRVHPDRPVCDWLGVIVYRHGHTVWVSERIRRAGGAS